MKKLGKGIITALPFIAMVLFVLVPIFINVTVTFFDFEDKFSFVGWANYEKIQLSKLSFEMLRNIAILSIISFISKVFYVFCGMLGIGAIKNKWVRMVMLFVAGLSFVRNSIPLEALYVILVIFLFPQKTGIKHAWYSTLVFMGLYIVVSISAIMVSPVVDFTLGGAPGIYTMFALRLIPAMIVGIIGSIVLLRLKNRTYTEKKIHKANVFGNIYIILCAVVGVTTVISTLASTSIIDLTGAFGELVIAFAVALGLSIIILALSMTLAYNLDKKAGFIITCMMIAVDYNVNFYILPLTGTVRALILMLTLLTKYMMIIAVIFVVFGRGKTVKKNIPAMTAMIFPLYSGAIRLSNIVSEWETKNILSSTNTLTESFDTYVYNVGRVSTTANAETVTAIFSFILICIGIVIATAMLKREE